MVANTLSHLPFPKKEEVQVLTSNKSSGIKSKGDFMLYVRQIFNGFVLLVTIILGVAAISPGNLNIPVLWQPWGFLASIFWFVAYCSGMFKL